MSCRWLPSVLLLLLIWSCDNRLPEAVAFEFRNDSLYLNPSGYAPLSAEFEVRTNISSSISIEVMGKDGALSAVRQDFDRKSRYHKVPVLGLYADEVNEILVTYRDSVGTIRKEVSYTVYVPPLSDDYPEIVIESAAETGAEGWTFVSYFGHNSTLTPQRPFIYDRSGKIRWTVDFSGHPQLNNFFYDNGMERLENGNLFFGEARTDRIYEIDMLGNVINSWSMPGFSYHHHTIELPNGNFVLSVTKKDIETVEDFLIEIDRSSGAILTTWDLRESLDQTRTTLTEDSVDWIHVNGLAYDPSDQTVILSGRTQGVIKLNWDNEVQWIISPHRGWSPAGNGEDLKAFLLQPLDAGSNPISDQAVLNGTAVHPDFDWVWYQHAPKVLPDGRLLLFDNGFNRALGNAPLYSRAVIYEIDRTAMTIRQDWSYGESRGEETYSFVVSDADYHAESGTVIMSPGAVSAQPKPYGKVIEIDEQTRQVLNEETIIPPIAALQLVTFHRTERMSLYP